MSSRRPPAAPERRFQWAIMLLNGKVLVVGGYDNSESMTNPTRLTNGSFQFAFTNSPGALFGVLTTTNVALPLTNWTALSGIVEFSPGQFQFTDPQATNSRQRFCRVRSQ